MKKEFNLSEKRKAYTDCEDKIFFDPEDIKEFINVSRNDMMKLENEEVDNEVWIKRADVIHVIKERAGAELI